MVRTPAVQEKVYTWAAFLTFELSAFPLSSLTVRPVSLATLMLDGYSPVEYLDSVTFCNFPSVHHYDGFERKPSDLFEVLTLSFNSSLTKILHKPFRN